MANWWCLSSYGVRNKGVYLLTLNSTDTANSAKITPRKKYSPHKQTIFKRYIDGTSVVWPHGLEKFSEFLAFMKNLRSNIQFTVGTEKEGMLPFLDRLIYRRHDGTVWHSAYRKPIHTDVSKCRKLSSFHVEEISVTHLDSVGQSYFWSGFRTGEIESFTLSIWGQWFYWMPNTAGCV